jgi:glutamate-1-semialdehyde 2,1-aminomutase
MAWLARAKKVTPGGASTLSKRSRAFVEGQTPTCYTKAKGCRLWDLDGREYLDFGMALCAVPLGYGYPHVVRAVQQAAENGWIASLPHESELVAERFLPHIPCAKADGMVRWVNTGTEANEAAIRVARRHTGKSVILSSGYHGWTSTFMCLQDMREGIPADYNAMMVGFGYNDLPSLDRALKAHRGAVAGIILEPTLFDEPLPGFLEGVRERATKAKAVLIYDEIVTGYRWHRGGYQAVCGVVPDVATFGKGIGSGFPVAALVGPAAIMAKADCISGTYAGNAGALAAVSATCDVYDVNPVCEYLHTRGSSLRRSINEYGRRNGWALRVEGQPYHPRLAWDGDTDRCVVSLLVQEMAKRGVLVHPGGLNLSFAHSQADIAVFGQALWDALQAMADGMPLKGLPWEPAFVRDPGSKTV